jgi:hypothetical protein
MVFVVAGTGCFLEVGTNLQLWKVIIALIFVTGVDEETGQLVVGFHAGGAKVNKVSTVKHNFPPHVVEAAQVGISLVDMWCFHHGDCELREN